MAEEKELDQIHQAEFQKVKYIRELKEYWDAYMYALINEVYVGIGINLGLTEKEAYKLAKQRLGTLQKATFFKSIFDKFKSIFSYKVPKFRYKKKLYGDGKPMTPDQWDKFNESLSKYWSENTQKISEEMAVKGFMLGKNTSEFRQKKKPYENKSLEQVVTDQYDGEMPKNIKEAYEKYDFKNSEKRIINKSLSNIAMYVTKTNNDLEENIRQQIQAGINNGKSVQKIASDLYWEIDKDPEGVNKYTAENMRKNWNRIASTEIATVYETAILAPYEVEAMESMKDPEKAVYFVRTGGSCSWCAPRQGTIVRLVPATVVVNQKSESLREMGIIDKNTDVGVWPGKNNVGLKQKDWLICCPAHPHNSATFEPIDLETEYYNPKTGNVEKIQKKQKFIPQSEDYHAKIQQEKEIRKPKYIGNNLVQYNNNIYEEVSPSEYNKKLEEHNKNPQLPIPVASDSTRYDKIFGEAKRNQE